MKDLTLIPIEDNKTYFINKNGEVFTSNWNRSGRLRAMRLNPDGCGYLGVMFSINKIKRRYLVHRLVALTFIPNTENKRTVNHEDGNKENNNVNNLSWMSYSENHKHAYDTLNRVNAHKKLHGSKSKCAHTISQVDKDGNIVKKWGSMNEAMRAGYSISCIWKCVHGKRSTHKGFKWIRI